MLQAAANLAPRGVYVCGNTTTSSGLTVTLTKETGSNDYALEAGALVLGDQGHWNLVEVHVDHHGYQTAVYKLHRVHGVCICHTIFGQFGGINM